MSKNDNKELNAILEQLKKSYSDDEEIESAIAEESQDDFQQMLSNYFSDNDSDKDIYKFTVSQTPDEENITAGEDYSIADLEEFEVVEEESAEEEVIEEAVEEESIEEELVEEEIFEEEIVEEEIIEEEIIEEESVEEEIFEEEIVEDLDEDELVDDEVINDDKAIVDDVFAAMFPSSSPVQKASEDFSQLVKEGSVDSELNTESIAKMFDLDPIEDDIDESEISDMPSASDAYEFIAEDVMDVADASAYEYSYIDKAEEVLQDEAVFNEPESVVVEEKETIDDIVSHMEIDDQDEIELDVSALLPKKEDEPCEVVQDIESSEVEEQTYFIDPLQGHLSDAAFVKYKIADDEVNFDIEEEAPELDDEEISLLIDFGYDDEAEAEVGRERTNEIKIQEKIALSSTSDNTIYGYYGKEYTDNKQISRIKNKYAKDKRTLFIKSAIAFSVAIVMFFIFVINCFGDHTNYILTSLLELILLAVVSVIAFAPLKKGVIGLFKIEPNFYSVSSIVVAITALYNLFSIIYFTIEGNMFFDAIALPCGFLGATYVLAILISEYFECTAEANTFDVISGANRLYTAEKFKYSHLDATTSAKKKSINLLSGELFDDNAFEVRKTSTPSGYFGRMSKKQTRISGSFYIIGTVFLVSLILGCVVLIKESSITLAACSSMLIVLMGMPMSLALIKSIPKLVSSIELKEKNCAIVGDASVEDYASARTLIFDDESAIEIVDKIEIRPEGDSDVANSMKIAARAFKAIGGPISMVVSDKFIDSDESQPEISLLAVRDNGIEFYMDSSIYMLIGDAAFMSMYGIRVSSTTDSRVSTDQSKQNNIIYVAIDGVPKLGYIIQSKVKDSFSSLVSELDKHGIKTVVESYDPTINDYYFEQNKIFGTSTINAYKPETFNNRAAEIVVDGSIFAAEDAKNIIYPLLEVKKFNSLKNKNRIFSSFMAIVGCIVASLFIFLALLVKANGITGFVSLILILIFHAISILPIILNSFVLKRRKRDNI